MMTIRIHQLRLETIVGVHAWEQNHPRPILVDIALECDAEQAIATDSIRHTVDYNTLSEQIIAAVSGRRYHLIETLAQHVLDMIAEDLRVQAAQVKVFKPGALEVAESVSVEARWVRQ